jgi:hypothetical protein
MSCTSVTTSQDSCSNARYETIQSMNQVRGFLHLPYTFGLIHFIYIMDYNSSFLCEKLTLSKVVLSTDPLQLTAANDV